MRVLHVMAGKGNGGAELYSTDVMLSLHEAGVDQCVVMRPDAPRAAELHQAGLRMAPQVLRHAVRPLQWWRMRRLIAREQPDIIHCWMRRAASLVPAKAQMRAEVIGWFGDYERHMRENGVPPEKAAYIPTFPSVDDAPAIDRAALATAPEARVLLTLSRLHQVKGLDTMLHALVSLPDCVLWIAGDGPMRAELEALAVRLEVAGRVRFLGWRTDRGALLRAADICLLPSRYEPFGTVILDAWQAGTAFIACDSDGPRAYIRNGENGMLVPVDDSAALAAAARAVLDDDSLRQRIATQGHAEYLAEFTREAVTRQWIDYYEGLEAGLLAQRKPSGIAAGAF
jgi:hypothetical protein